ncbi:dienelactone hydrolase family protein [Limnohabitans sp. 2KL-27]|uniref:dienelactone hydrolase family protein n=1 Tax=Limnohabitans sp. 2KL-27 TaxID=1100705 RepID=UPI000AF70CDF|nr:dienelactone hydrolase family protein [Limnohabitans sp. 2KL-27]
MGTMMELHSADGTAVPAYEARPAGIPKGAVVVIQEIFGVNSHIRAVADGYAAEGYLAVAPAAFHRVKPWVTLGYTDADMGEGFGYKTAVEALPAPGVMQDIQAAIDHAAQASGGKKVGIVGYCWGGLLTWRAACTLSGLSAAVPYYGGGMTTEVEAARQPRVPVLAHFAEEDKWIALDTVVAFQKAHPEVAVHTYAAHHGFNCDQRGSWHAPSAQLARERTLAFFKQHMG